MKLLQNKKDLIGLIAFSHKPSIKNLFINNRFKEKNYSFLSIYFTFSQITINY
jgi:hypothetical protein